jgi:rubrerythrin
MLKKIFAVIVAALMLLSAGGGGAAMAAGLAKTPIDLEEVHEEDRDKEILRMGIIAELDAINLYEQMAAYAENEKVKKIMLDVAREEKTHVGEFHAILEQLDKEYADEVEKGEEEAEEILEAKE